MQKLRINGGHSLKGELAISGSKNAALPIMAACLLCPNEIQIENVPNLRDIKTMGLLLSHMGATIEKGTENTIKINAKNNLLKSIKFTALSLKQVSFVSISTP